MAKLIFAAATIYFGILCSKTYTWVFVSSDSGDWLAASNWWMVPQPYGSPLYILLGHFLNLFPGDLVIKMTVLLSVIPSALTVTLVYLIVRKLTSREGVAVVSSLVLLGSAVFLTQSTVLEEYAIAAMLLVLGFWCYVSGYRYRTAICWGLGTAVHVFVLGAILFWLIVEWKSYVKPLLVVTVPIVAVFYGFILLLMYLDTPRLLAGELSIYSLKQYLTVTAGVILGQLSIFEAPQRLFLTSRLLLMSFGLALVPLVRCIKKPLTKPVAVMLGIILWTLWYQITNMDPLAWTFITYASPFIAVLIGIGLSRMSIVHLRYVAVSALVLVVINGVFLNANVLTNEKPLATTYYEDLWELPNNSIVLCNPGPYSLGLYYAMSEGKDLIPLVYPYIEDWHFFDYALWLHLAHGVETLVIIDETSHRWKDTLEIVEDSLDRGIYYADSPWQLSDVRRALQLEDTQWPQIKKVVGLTGLAPEPYLK